MGTTSRTSFRTSSVATAVTAIAVMGLATACHSRNTSQSGSPTATPIGAAASHGPTAAASASTSPHAGSSPGTHALAMCQTPTLTVTLDGSQAGGAAGSTYFPVDFANRSGTACALAGYPGVSFVTAAGTAGRQIGAAAARNPAFSTTVVRLAPGGYAHGWLQVAEAANYPQSSCRPATAIGLRIYPPGETRPGYVRRDFQACAAASAPLLTVMPLRPGKGVQGTTP